MKTTLELPDPLMRQVKIRAAKTDRKLKDVVTDLIKRGLADVSGENAADRARLDLTQYIGAFPRYKTMNEVVEYVRELRKDRDEA